jgi:hypothetical protein
MMEATMGVEFEMYSPNRDAIYDLDKGRGNWDMPAENTREAWMVQICKALQLRPDEDVRYAAAVADDLVAFCSLDFADCWITSDAYETVAEKLGRNVPIMRCRHDVSASDVDE